LRVYPNPVDGIASIRYCIRPPAGQVSGNFLAYLGDRNIEMQIFDAYGRVVDRIDAGKVYEGTNRIEWNAAVFSPGIYLVRLQAGNYYETAKILIQ